MGTSHETLQRLADDVSTCTIISHGIFVPCRGALAGPAPERQAARLRIEPAPCWRPFGFRGRINEKLFDIVPAASAIMREKTGSVINRPEQLLDGPLQPSVLAHVMQQVPQLQLRLEPDVAPRRQGQYCLSPLWMKSR
jgi:hypothetical protein